MPSEGRRIGVYGAESTIGRRLAGLVVALAAAAILGVALWLSPDPEGHGTHTQLGLPSCSWIQSFGTPCPTCGMTTSFTHAVRGDFIGSFKAQPFGFILSIATAGALLMGLYVGVTGSSVATVMAKWWGTKMVWILIAMLLAAWVYKILVIREVI